MSHGSAHEIEEGCSLITVMIKLIPGSVYIRHSYSVSQMNRPAAMTPTFPS